MCVSSPSTEYEIFESEKKISPGGEVGTHLDSGFSSKTQGVPGTPLDPPLLIACRKKGQSKEFI